MIVSEKPVDADPAALAGVPLGALAGGGLPPDAGRLRARRRAGRREAKDSAGSVAASDPAALRRHACWPSRSSARRDRPLPLIRRRAEERGHRTCRRIGGRGRGRGVVSASAPFGPLAPVGDVVGGPAAVVARQRSVGSAWVAIT